MKKIEDFPDLLKFKKTVSNLTSELRLSHFKNGLDPSLVINTDLYINSNTMHRINITELNIFCFLLFLESYNYIEKKETYDYFKENIVSFKNEGKVSQNSLNSLAFFILDSKLVDIEIFEFLIKKGLVDINTKTEDGRSFYYYVKNKTEIKLLKNLGCDINARTYTPYGSKSLNTVYEIALNAKKKAWISNLQHFVLYSEVVENNTKLLEEFKLGNYNKQLFMLFNSFKNNNNKIIEEILNNQKKYHKLLTYKDSEGLNLIHYAMKNHSHEILSDLMKCDVFKNKKNYINRYGFCYTSYAITNGYFIDAKYLCEKDFFVRESLDRELSRVKDLKRKKSLFYTTEKLRNNANIILNFLFGDIEKAKEQLSNISKEELLSFFLKFNFILKKEKYFPGSSLFIEKVKIKLSGNDSDKKDTMELSKNDFLFFLDVLKKQEELDKENADINLKKFIRSLSLSNIHDSMMKILFEQYPNRKSELLGYLGDDPISVKFKTIGLKEIFESQLPKNQEIKVKKNKI